MGASSGADKAQRRAERAERQRQQQIRQTTARVDSIFDAPSRRAQYGDFVSALRGFYTDDANRQKERADRNLRFSMARAGLTGGSAAADAGRTLADEYREGILDAERRAQGSLADLMSSDEQSRLNLIQMAQAGLDTTTAAQRAASSMRANLGSARSSGLAEGLGDIFGNTAEIYQQQNKAARDRRMYLQGANALSAYGNPWRG